MSMADLQPREYDFIVVGAGHNGLCCAAYLAREYQRRSALAAKARIVVLEQREAVGGACTMRTKTLADGSGVVKYSPCAYLCGLFHQRVIDELGLQQHGFHWTAAKTMFVPFADGSAVLLHDDASITEAEIVLLGAEADLEGWRAMEALFERTRQRLREGDSDIWLATQPPTPDDIRALLADDPGAHLITFPPQMCVRNMRHRRCTDVLLEYGVDAQKLILEWSIVELVDRYLSNDKLKAAVMGQGLIGTNASPTDAGTAYIWFHHKCGCLFGEASSWGYVRGGMGAITQQLAAVCRESGVEIVLDCRVESLVPGSHVVAVLAGDSSSPVCFKAPVIVSNADPYSTMALVPESERHASWVEHVRSIPIDGCSMKANVLLSQLPDFTARPNTTPDAIMEHHTGEIDLPLTQHEWIAAYEAIQRGELPPKLWCELYFQTAVDDTVAPKGVHHMSVFAHHVPYRFASGDWDSHREQAKQLVLARLAEVCSNIPAAIIDIEILGPPDIEETVGLYHGHIFQGDCLPQYMWSNRLSYATPMKGTCVVPTIRGAAAAVAAAFIVLTTQSNRSVLVWRLHAPGWLGDWHQWSECCAQDLGRAWYLDDACMVPC